MKVLRLQAATGTTLSFGEIRELLCDAICTAAGADNCCYIVDCYPDSVVYELCGSDGGEQYYQRSYSIVDGQVTLGEATAVERQVSYIPLQAGFGRLLAATGAEDTNDYGYTWRVQICQYGQAEGRNIIWPREPLVAAMPLYEGARVFCLMDTQHVQAADRPCGKSVREIVGWIENVVDTGVALEGDFQILKAAGWLRDMAVDSFRRGKEDLFGFSHDVTATTKTQMVAGKAFKVPVEIKSVEVDVVYNPTNDGKLLRMAAATDQGRKESDEMKREQLVAALKRKRPGQYVAHQTAIDDGTMTDEQILDLLAATDGQQQSETGAEILRQMQLIASRSMIRETLTSSGLPAPVVTKLQNQFDGQVVEESVLQAAIKTEKEVLDALTGSGIVRNPGQARVIRDSGEKLQAGFDRMLRVPVADNMQDIPGFSSLRAAYVEVTGDSEVTGFGEPSRLQAGFDTSTFSYLLGNTLYRRLIADYRETTDFGLSRIISNVRNATDFRPLQALRVGYFGDIPDVNPENNDYADLGTMSDELVQYALNQKGGVITITRKMILNDDLSAIQRIISRLPRAARRTRAKRAWNLFINNTTYGADALAIFHATHGNLGATAYAIATAVAARLAIAKQVEPNSGERLYLRPVTLAIPSDLWDTAVTVNQTRGIPGTQNQGNSMFQYFGANNENIVEVPFMTDTNDWMMFADPKDVEILEVAYLNGQQEPQMFTADNPVAGQFFVADKLQYKIRDEYEYAVMDYRGAFKAVVP